jgi:hypothetical protein
MSEYAGPASGNPQFLAAGLTQHMRDGGVPFLWDLVDVLQTADGGYVDALADCLAIAIDRMPPAVTLPGAET